MQTLQGRHMQLQLQNHFKTSKVAKQSFKFLKLSLLVHTTFNYVITFLFYRSNLVKGIVFVQWKALQYFSAYLELRAYLNIKFPMDFHNRSADHCSFESFININELTFIMFLWDGGIIIAVV